MDAGPEIEGKACQQITLAKMLQVSLIFNTVPAHVPAVYYMHCLAKQSNTGVHFVCACCWLFAMHAYPVIGMILRILQKLN